MLVIEAYADLKRLTKKDGTDDGIVDDLRPCPRFHFLLPRQHHDLFMNHGHASS